MSVAIQPLTADLWPQFETLFGPKGACYGCWCTHFRLAPKVRQQATTEDRKSFIKSVILDGPPPGLIALVDGEPAAWVQVTPRSAVPRWNTDRTVSRPLTSADKDDPGVFAISCFFARSKFRGRGLSHLLVDAAKNFARQQGASVLEACPMKAAKSSRSISLFVGSVQVFEKAGFETVAERKNGRPLMRFCL